MKDLRVLIIITVCILCIVLIIHYLKYRLPIMVVTVICALLLFLVTAYIHSYRTAITAPEKQVIDRLKNQENIEPFVKPLKKLTIKESRSRIDPNKKFADNVTLLHIAVEKNDLQNVKILLESGADPNVRSKDTFNPFGVVAIGPLMFNGRTPLQIAVDQENCTLARLLIQHGANVNVNESAHKNQYTKSPLLEQAVYHGNIELAELLLQSGATTERVLDTAFQGLSTIFMGRENPRNSDEIIVLLLKYGCDRTCRDYNHQKLQKYITRYIRSHCLVIKTNVIRYLSCETPPGYRKVAILYKYLLTETRSVSVPGVASQLTVSADDTKYLIRTIAKILECTPQQLAGVMVVYAKTGIFLHL